MLGTAEFADGGLRERVARLRQASTHALANASRAQALWQGHVSGMLETQRGVSDRRQQALLHLGGQFSRPGGVARAAQDYLVDALQRQVLFLDTLRQRGNIFLSHQDAGMPPVLDFAYETVVDGRALPRAVNYSLVRVIPPAGVTIDGTKRPFMIVDPRAGHGAGIGGFKPDSQVGEAFEDGHPVYFVVFRPVPEPGQTLMDVRDAERHFLREIARLHPEAPKPVVVGNCQGGWATMLLAASAPEDTGPVAINGAPMSYWAGKTGSNPMRYLGGLFGGALPVMIYADLGNGVFDGSLLVSNFESMNPANTHWKKYYNLYANIDREGERFLEFERWWGGFFMMNESEIRWIVDNLFIGNRLARGEAVMGGERVDLHRIKSPILVFASHGDNITPPQQALNWIPDLYRDAAEIKARGQRIVYMVHDSIGHLGIFVSAKIAGREHDAITDTMRAIEALSPGLYEMSLDEGPDRLHIRFEPRTMEDILALDDGREDEALFATVARLSELGSELYDMFGRPLVRAMVTPESASAFFAAQPLRMRRAMMSDRNPLLTALPAMAEQARASRQPVPPDNPFLALERFTSDMITQSLDLYRDMRDGWYEVFFHSLYGSPWMRMLGEKSLVEARRHSTEDLRSLPDVQAALAKTGQGGAAEGTVRMLALLAQARGYVRRTRLERAAATMGTSPLFAGMSADDKTRLIHEQSLIVDFEPEKAIATLPDLLDTTEKCREALDLVMTIAGPEADMHPAALKLYRELEIILSHDRGLSAMPAAAE
jgi:pimeloyl-ACP methyl ester carboxylesterase